MALLHHDARRDGLRARTLGEFAPRAARRRLREDLIQAGIVTSVAVVVALYIADGGLSRITGLADAIGAIGIAAGLVGTDLVLIMLLLAARTPFIDRTIGHDRAMSIHGSLGKPAFLLIVAHVALLLASYALAAGTDLWTEAVAMWTLPDMPLAVLGFALMALVVVTSLVAVRRRFRYEVWHLVHLSAYAAALAALPHQFSLGGMFAEGTWQRWFWMAAVAAVFAALVVFRFAAPVVQTLRHRPTVAAVEPLAPGVVSIVVTGRRLDALAARGGQFLIWRFLARGQWWQAHPYSLSEAPRADRLRITVRALGDGSGALAGIRPGTRVALEGPYGVFTDDARTSERIAFIGAGIGVTPIRSLLEDARFRPGQATVVLRSPEDAPPYLFDEIAGLCRAKGATCITVPGPRGRSGWLTDAADAAGHSLVGFVPDARDTDFYICGPREWSDRVVADAAAAGVPEERIHRERFDW
ncbi:ferredoxin reductase family protein [Agromyces sp. SYSU T00194]|uniref:ferredoxin reductase family protein n=1 Tax=Agromyces chitinivorans TaxID=3158560 RepID=UPI003394AFF2